MKRLVTALSVVAAVCQTLPLHANEIEPGNRVQGVQRFFVCGAREDLASIRALDRSGDKETALKVGMQRCEAATSGSRFIVDRADAEALCIRPDGGAFCLWAWRSSVQIAPSQ